jgi:hypothetical protein
VLVAASCCCETGGPMCYYCSCCSARSFVRVPDTRSLVRLAQRALICPLSPAAARRTNDAQAGEGLNHVCAGACVCVCVCVRASWHGRARVRVRHVRVRSCVHPRACACALCSASPCAALVRHLCRPLLGAGSRVSVSRVCLARLSACLTHMHAYALARTPIKKPRTHTHTRSPARPSMPRAQDARTRTHTHAHVP